MPNELTKKSASLHVDTHRQSNTGLTRSCVMAGKETRVKTRMKTGVKILSAIRANNMITREELAQSLAMTIKGVDWQIAKLKQEGVLKRIGPDKGGHWEIL
jgi:predicted HTH transcriptional regulator